MCNADVEDEAMDQHKQETHPESEGSAEGSENA